MTRKFSEAKVREALADMDLELLVYKPQDFAGPSQNRKPADFLVWWEVRATIGGSFCFIEVKETPAVGIFGLGAAFQTGQVATMRQAVELGIRYLVVIRWSKHRVWTITTAGRVLRRLDDERYGGSYDREQMPMECRPAQLESHLRAAMLGEIDE